MNRGKTYKLERQRNYKTFFAQNNNKTPVLSTKAIQYAKPVKGAIRRNFVPIKRCSDRINLCKQIISKKAKLSTVEKRNKPEAEKLMNAFIIKVENRKKSKDRNEVYFRTTFPGKEIQSIFRNIPRKIILRLPGRKQKRVRTIHCRLAGYDIKRKELKDDRNVHVYRLEVERSMQRSPMKRKRHPRKDTSKGAARKKRRVKLPYIGRKRVKRKRRKIHRNTSRNVANRNMSHRSPYGTHVSVITLRDCCPNP
ncbi:hypothetical protein CEXT_276011 [Caerostris extrusa]|uniref:Uncharacterized protein n=1 Tax=Caerostris extrusa TaxID=172846 RepID=A0AAV4SJM0_CAEEX|nr:hypothetical protein CEXT_276011 [Caerostris extrusa]